MFAADCPTKRASSFITDMTLGRWSHVPAFQFVCFMITRSSLRLFAKVKVLGFAWFCYFHAV